MGKKVLLIILAAILLGVWWWPSNTNTTLKLESPAFAHGEFIGAKYTCDELNISPPLEISGVPAEAKSLVLVMDDPDVPKELRPSGVFDHWVLYNIPPTATFFDEGEFQGTAGHNGRGEAKYTGPCPPTEYEPTTHRYFFKLYALNIAAINFIKAPTKEEVLIAIEEYVIAEAELMGKYDRLKTIREND